MLAMFRTTSWFAGVVACLSLACAVGPGAADEGAENDDTETGGGQGVCDDVDSPRVPPLADPDTCDSYSIPDAPGWGPGEIVIVNQTDEAIILLDQSSGCHQPARWFSLVGEHQGRALELPLLGCASEWPACQLYMEASVGCLECATIYLPIYIEPGGRWRTTWDPWVTIDVTLPAACSSSGASEACSVPIAPPPGDYQAQAVAAFASECVTSDCTCEVDEEGSCPLDDLADVGPSLTADAVWSAGCGPVELVFAS